MKNRLITLSFFILILTQCQQPNLSGKIIYNESFWGAQPVVTNLMDMKKETISVPISYQPSIVESSGALNIFRPSFNKFEWSNNGHFVAFPCLRENETLLAICVWDANFLTLKNATPFQSPTYFLLVPSNNSSYPEKLIQNMSWAPDDDSLIVAARWNQIESPCVIELHKGKIECGINTMFWKGFSEDDLRIIAGAFEIAWSPVDATKMSIPLRKNWLSVVEDGKINIGEKQSEYYVGLPTNDYQEGIYVVDLKSKKLLPVWLAKENLRVDSRHKVLWSNNGTQIFFVYLNESDLLIPNYIVSSINIETKEEDILFDGKSFLYKIKHRLPERFYGGALRIYLSSQSPDDRYLFFEVSLDSKQQNNDGEAYLLGGFVYDMKTKDFYQIVDYIYTNYREQSLGLDWVE